MSKIIGIDLGTGNSCCYVMEGKDAKCITNPNGGRTTPSVINITDKEILVGESAKRQAVMSPENTIFAVKRLIGRKYKDKEVQDWKKIAPYKIVESPNGDACVEVNGKVYSPTELSSFILAQLKKDAEAYLGEKVSDAIITVPAYFNDAQRQATKDAGKISGLEVKRIINEPTAAALAYSFENQEGAKIAIIDFGSGTLDSSILEVGDGVVETLSTNGNTFLGGSDYDSAIINWLVSEFREEFGIDLSQDKMALQRLKDASETAKIELSTMMETQINIPFITADATGPKHLMKSLTRSKFEQMTSDITDKMFVPIKNALDDAKLKPSDISEVVLVGGTTRIPIVQERLKEFFGKEPNKSVNPDEVVAMGASCQGAIISGDIKDVLLLDVTPLSLGIETAGNVFTKIIDRNTTIPTKKSQVFSTASDNQSTVSIVIGQGERPMMKDNHILGRFDLTGIPLAPRGIPQIEVTFNIDANGIINVSAKDLGTNNEQNIVINPSGGLSKEEIDKLMKESELHAEEDKKKLELIEAKNKADGLIFSVEKTLKELPDGVASDSDKADITSKLDTLKKTLETEDIERIKSDTDNLQQAMYSISEKMYQQKTQQEQPSGFTQQKKPNDDVMDADFTEV